MATQLADNPTRQQLDELDALLQKMLAMPSSGGDAPPVGKSAPTVPPKVRELKQETVATPPPPAPPKFPVPEVAFGLPPAAAFAADSPASPAAIDAAKKETEQTWSIDLNPRNGSSVLGARSPLADGGKKPTASERLTPPTMLQVKPMETLSAQSMIDVRRKSTAKPDVPLVMQPLSAVTAWFDDLFAGLGPIGRLVSGPFGRGTMGYSGMAMLGASATYCALIWAGWIR